MGINQLIALEAEMMNQYRGVSEATVLAGYNEENSTFETLPARIGTAQKGGLRGVVPLEGGEPCMRKTIFMPSIKSSQWRG